MTPATVHLVCEHIVVQTDAERVELERVSGILRDAFARLAERLQKLPGSRWTDVERWAFDRLEVDMASTEELLGPRGAERLAEALFRSLMEKTV